MKNFFISYNNADKTWAEWIAWELSEAGQSVAIQAWDFPPGGNFVLEMHRAAAECERTIAILSPEYLAAEFTQPEWAAAFVQDPTGKQRKLIPIRVRECKPDGLLKPIVYIDLVGIDNEPALHERLFEGLMPSGRPATKPNPLAIRKPKKFPGAPPTIWNVRDDRNPNFTGRETELLNLRSRLVAKSHAAVTASGPGGIGKSQLVTQYAFRYATDYDLVWWMKAEELTTLALDFGELAKQLGLDEKRAVEQVREYLRKATDWLIIFDNAGAPDIYKEYVPHGPGHVLITSRNLTWPGAVELQVLPREDAIKFLEDRSGHNDRKADAKLCELLGDLPLALEHAAAYILATGISIASYVNDFGEYLKDVIDKIAANLRPSFDRLATGSPKSLDLLSIAAFYAPDDIPSSLLQQSVPDKKELNAAIAGLRRYALVDAREETISIHRLVQQAARDRLADKSKWCEIALQAITNAFPYKIDDVATWEPSRRLLAHALDAASHSELLGVALGKTSLLLNSAGVYVLYQPVQLAAARDAMERALAIGEGRYGPDRPGVATLVDNLAQILRAQGDLAGARRLTERALAIDENACGPDHPDVANRASNLGQILLAQGDLEGARRLTERALAIDEKAYGPDHPAIGIRASNLGLILRAQRDLEGARRLTERALSMAEEAFGPDHPDVAIRAANLGGIMRDQGDLEGARRLSERALAIGEKAYGPDHPQVAIYRSNLGPILFDQGDPKGARCHTQNALRIFQACYGENHPRTIREAASLRSLDQPPTDWFTSTSQSWRPTLPLRQGHQRNPLQIPFAPGFFAQFPAGRRSRGRG